MKSLKISLVVGLLLLTLPVLAASESHVHGIYVHTDKHFDSHLDGVDIDLDGGSIILKHRDRRAETVEITEDYQLYVNGYEVDLDDDQRALVAEYYELGMEIVDYAKELGWEGARIGLSGAKLGLKAVGNLAKLIFTSYDTEDFEREMEREAGRLEARAEVLESRAEEIEDMAEELVDIEWEMNREIPELRELDWF
jgi:hypothetical protein